MSTDCTPAALTVIRCAGCAGLRAERDELAARVAELDEVIALLAESQHHPAAAPDPAPAAEPARSTMPELLADAAVRDRGVITIPPKIRTALGVSLGDSLRFKLAEDGTVTVRLLRLIEA